MAEGAGAAVDGGEVLEALRALEGEGQVMLGGEGPRRSVRRMTGVM